MILKTDGSYNKKLDFKMIYFLNADRDRRQSISRQQKVFHGIRKPRTKDEHHIVASKMAYEILKEQGLGARGLLNAYRCYQQESLALEEKIKKCAWIFGDLKDPSPINNAIFCLVHVIKHDIFGAHSERLAVIILSAFLVREGYHPVFFHSSAMQRIVEMIKMDTDFDILLFEVERIIQISAKYNITRNVLTSAEVVGLLRSQKKRLETQFDIESLEIHGSYARGEQGIYSDIDVIAYPGEKPYRQRDRLIGFLEGVTDLAVDLTVVDGRPITGFSRDFRKRILPVFIKH